MTSKLEPIRFYGGALGPNPSKVATILTELSVPYEATYIPFNELKGPEYTKVNPNGRVPAIEDPNTGIKLWESGAIIEYLISKYDPNHTISFPAGSKEDFLTKQWLFFQVSGQGPYYGQGNWFKHFHSEKLPSAVQRYVNEIKRVTGVLEGVLEGKTFLVGEKCTYADLAFISWQDIAQDVIVGPEEDLAKQFPNVEAWMGRMKERTSVKTVHDEAERKKSEMSGK